MLIIHLFGFLAMSVIAKILSVFAIGNMCFADQALHYSFMPAQKQKGFSQSWILSKFGIMADYTYRRSFDGRIFDQLMITPWRCLAVNSKRMRLFADGDDRKKRFKGRA